MARNDYKGADDHGLRLKGSPHFLSFNRYIFYLMIAFQNSVCSVKCLQIIHHINLTVIT